MPELDPKYKLKFISNLEKAGITDVDYEDVMDDMESMVNQYTPVKSDDAELENFDFSQLKDMTPEDILTFSLENSDTLRDAYGINSENMEKFLSGLNKSNVMPYKAYKSSKDEGSEWGFYKSIDRYEKAYDRNQKPIYLRFYEDGTYDQMDKETFDKEKYFNYLPSEVKENPMIRINESAMTETQKANMYNRIREHQRGL